MNSLDVFGSATFCLVTICLVTFCLVTTCLVHSCLVTFCLGNFFLVQVCLVTFCLGNTRACFLPIAFYKTNLSKIKHFFKLNQLNFNELNVREQLNCILSSNFNILYTLQKMNVWLYIRYIYIFFNYSLHHGV